VPATTDPLKDRPTDDRDAPVALRMTGVSKRFGAVRALRDVTVEFRAVRSQR